MSPLPFDRIYHLALSAEWAAARARGGPYDRSTLGKSLDEVGFIHCSYAEQVQGTADLIFRGRADVVLLTVDPERLGGTVRVENLVGGEERFPHVYGPIPLDAILGVEPVALGTDGRLDLAAHLGQANRPGSPPEPAPPTEVS